MEQKNHSATKTIPSDFLLLALRMEFSTDHDLVLGEAFRLLKQIKHHKRIKYQKHLKGSPSTAVKLLSSDHEVMISSPGNNLLQKCRERLCT
jgi:hypothetical protein